MIKSTHVAAILAMTFGAGLSAPAAVQAQEFGLSGEIGLGARVRPGYFGSDDYTVGPIGRFGLEALTYGPISSGTPGVARDTTGFRVRGAFRIVPGRSADDFPELAGLEDVDLSVEMGLGAQYEGRSYRVFADARYGVIGHGALVSEVGADYIMRPGDDWEISVGPRLFFGSDDYANTYFGVTAAEAGASASAFSAYQADGGLVSMGLDMRVERQLNDDWSLRGDLEISEFVNSAADSPIVQQGNARHAIVGITLARRFSFGF